MASCPQPHGAAAHHGLSAALAVLVVLSVSSLVHSAYVALPVILQAVDAKSFERQAQAISERMESDPKLGSRVSVVGLCDSAGKRLHIAQAPRYRVLLFVSQGASAGCTTCQTTDHVNALDKLARLNPRLDLYVVWVGQPDLRGRSAASSALGAARSVVDPSLAVSHRLNVVFFPRVYLLSPRSELLYLSGYRASERAVTRGVLFAIAMHQEWRPR